jgi:hypothetical protein
VGREEAGMQGLVMAIDFIFLVIFNMSAHYDDGLPHEKHEDATEDRK